MAILVICERAEGKTPEMTHILLGECNIVGSFLTVVEKVICDSTVGSVSTNDGQKI